MYSTITKIKVEFHMPEISFAKLKQIGFNLNENPYQGMRHANILDAETLEIIFEVELDPQLLPKIDRLSRRARAEITDLMDKLDHTNSALIMEEELKKPKLKTSVRDFIENKIRYEIYSMEVVPDILIQDIPHSLRRLEKYQDMAMDRDNTYFTVVTFAENAYSDTCIGDIKADINRAYELVGGEEFTPSHIMNIAGSDVFIETKDFPTTILVYKEIKKDTK